MWCGFAQLCFLLQKVQAMNRIWDLIWAASSANLGELFEKWSQFCRGFPERFANVTSFVSFCEIKPPFPLPLVLGFFFFFFYPKWHKYIHVVIREHGDVLSSTIPQNGNPIVVVEASGKACKRSFHRVGWNDVTPSERAKRRRGAAGGQCQENELQSVFHNASHFLQTDNICCAIFTSNLNFVVCAATISSHAFWILLRIHVSRRETWTASLIIWRGPWKNKGSLSSTRVAF